MINGAEVTAEEGNDVNPLNKLFETATDYNCPDGTYHIQLSCDFFSKSQIKNDVNPEEFNECPFCAYDDHKYRIGQPGENVGGKCSKEEKNNRFSVEFIKGDKDYQSCCVKSHTKQSKRGNAAYNIHDIKKEIEQQKTQNEEEIMPDENKYAANERLESRKEEELAAKEQNAGFLEDANDTVSFTITRTLIIGALVVIFMIISSSFVYFK